MIMQYKTIDDLLLLGRRVLVRVDFNVPLAEDEDGNRTVSDDTRIRAALPTIQKILSDGGLPVLISHLGRPKGEIKPEFSLEPAARHLESLLGSPVVFVPYTIGEEAELAIASAAPGSVVVLENTRFLPGERKNDPELAAQLAQLGDVYINDAFGSAHRAHASTEGVTHHMTEKAMGYLLGREVNYLSQALEAPEHPFVAILGGAKVSDKIGVIEALLEKVDTLLIGGAMSYTFLKMQGHKTGTSLVEEDKLDDAKSLYERAKGKILLPVDHLVADAFDNDASQQTVAGDIPDGYMGLDIGSETVELYQSVLNNAKTVIWNGPMGVFEMPNFAGGTLAIARKLAQITDAGTLTVVGGGDSVAAITQAELDDDVSHVSTGGRCHVGISGRKNPARSRCSW